MLVLEGKIKEGNKVKYKFTQEVNNSYDIPSKVVMRRRKTLTMEVQRLY